jgi:cytochrome c5
MNLRAIFACVLAVPLGMMAAPERQKSDPAEQSSQHGASSSQVQAGERVFAANCSRCHQAPMSLSPRITGTVIMHMRTRARLSREDEKLLLRFLAP